MRGTSRRAALPSAAGRPLSMRGRRRRLGLGCSIWPLIFGYVARVATLVDRILPVLKHYRVRRADLGHFVTDSKSSGAQ